MKHFAAMMLLTALSLSGCVRPATDALAENPYGVCAHLNRMSQSETEKELAGIAATGIGYARLDFDWKQVEPREGEWDFSRLDAVVEAARKNGVALLPILGGEMPEFGRPPYRNQEKWLEFVGRCVARYRGKIDCYEVINEADCDRPWGEKPNPAHYAELLNRTARKIREADPDAKVIFTGVSDFGDPMAFVEAVFQAGGTQFDVMNFHPYQWRGLPESQLALRISDLRALLERYNLKKTIWITEIGNSSAPERYTLARTAVPAALKRLGFRPENTVIGVLEDEPTLFYTGSIDDYLKDWPLRKKVSFADLNTVPVSECPVLALPGREGFPAAKIGAVESYCRRGGTVILPGGLPFYFDFRAGDEPGTARTRQINAALVGRLHLAWEAFWTKPGVPNRTTATVAGANYPELKVEHRSSMRFLSSENCRGGDVFEPIVLGRNGAYEKPIAGLYRFNSDLKGNAIVVVDSDGTDSLTEDEQAARVPREFLIALASGVDRIFLYRYRAGEWNRGREAHFGIVRRNFDDKPARKTYAALVRFLPEGASRPELKRDGALFQAKWILPDGRHVQAWWSAFGVRNVPLPEAFRGELFSAAGERLPAQAVVAVGESPIYLLEK